MLWLGLHFPSLPLEVCTAALDADDRPPPVVIIEQGRVLLCNGAAAAAGIAPGCTLATAHSIAPELRHFRRSPEREHERLTLVAEALYGFSARVSLGPGDGRTPPSGIALEIGASLRLFGAADELVQRITGLCGELGHQVRARLARTPLAAWVLARADTADLGRADLAAVAVESAALSGDRIERLANMGIHTFGQLAALPRRELGRRFGSGLVDYLDRITGTRPDPRPALAPAERFRASLHLPEPVKDKHGLMFPMSRLLGDLQHWLVSRQLGAEQLRWRFAAGVPGEAGRVSMPVRFARARQQREAFLDVTRLRLEATALPDEILDITLEAPRLVEWRTRSHGLFRNLHADGDSLEEAGELVDQLRARLGTEACYSLEMLDSHTPEAAWRPAPPLGRRAAGDAGTGPAAPRRPLWLFAPPRPVDPARLTLLRGPERLHTGWWDTSLGEGSPECDAPAQGTTSPSPAGAAARPRSGEPMESRPGGRALALRAPSPTALGRSCEEYEHDQGQARDYYVARHVNGAECWVFVDPWERWFLQGYFA